jgi:hypothetical protein
MNIHKLISSAGALSHKCDKVVNKKKKTKEAERHGKPESRKTGEEETNHESRERHSG